MNVIHRRPHCKLAKRSESQEYPVPTHVLSFTFFISGVFGRVVCFLSRIWGFQWFSHCRLAIATFWVAKWQYAEISSLKRFEQIELPAKLLDYFLWSNKSNINQSAASSVWERGRSLTCPFPFPLQQPSISHILFYIPLAAPSPCRQSPSFFQVRWWSPSLIIEDPRDCPGPLPTFLCRWTHKWVQTVCNVCGLACILGLINLNNEISLTSTEHSTRSRHL